jgi:hypothetical protein
MENTNQPANSQIPPLPAQDPKDFLIIKRVRVIESIGLVIGLTIAAFFLGKYSNQTTYTDPQPLPVVSPMPPTEEDGVMCTADAMQCPDGSYVGRTGPNCEFVCPGATQSEASEDGASAADQINWKVDVDALEAHTMGEVRNYQLSVFYPENWRINKDFPTPPHDNDDLIKNCNNYLFTTPNGNKLTLGLKCSSSTGKSVQLPSNYTVVKNLGNIGNDASTKYLVRYPTAIALQQYGMVYVDPGQNLKEIKTVSEDILVMYQPDDWFFIPVNAVAGIGTEAKGEVAIMDQMVLKMMLKRQ